MFGNPIINDREWQTKELETVAPIINYKMNIISEKVWLLNLDMIKQKTGEIIDYVYEDIEKISSSTCSFSSKHVLYSKLRPYLNKVVLPDKCGYATSELLPLLPNEKFLNRIFLANLLRSDYFVNYISEKVAGTKMPRVSMDLFRKFEVIIPNIKLQNQFAKIVQLIDKQKFTYEKLINYYKKYIKFNYRGQIK